MLGLVNQVLEIGYRYIYRGDFNVIKYIIDSNLVNLYYIYLLWKGQNEDEKNSVVERDSNNDTDHDSSGGHVNEGEGGEYS